jgi:probable phosphomutase (TIGR03848 family)
MPVFLLIRHGENDFVKTGRLAGRLPGVHLNEKGRAQAQAVADKLQGAPLKAIYSSPMERALETAEPIAKALGLEVVVRTGLLETEIGEWQNQKVRGLTRSKSWKMVQSRPSLFCFPGGESFAETQQRIVQEIETLRRLHEPKDLIACVSHADPIKLALAYYIGLPLDLFQRLHVAPASISVLQVDDGGSHLMTLNYDVSFTFIFSPP